MSLLKIKDFAEEIHKNAVEHGWWDVERTYGEVIALCHSELSEALEEYRNGHDYSEIYTACKNCADRPKAGYNCTIGDKCDKWEQRDKPEGIPIELADCIIRILDICEWYGIDIEAALEIKHEYNASRPYRHGGKII
jgi:NTP pyrophosphatase (non-canonical NTP hydrolase)